MRRFIRIATFIVLGLFIVLCVGTSFVGSRGARMVVNSTPAVIFWAILFAVLCLSLAVFPRLRRSPLLLAIHGGTLLILFGSMYGSPIAHRLRTDYLGSQQVSSGYLYLREGWGSHTIMERDLKTEVGKLPFEVTLKDFTIERYPPPEPEWDLVMTAPTVPGEAKQGRHPHAQLDWQEGKEIPVEGTDIRVTVKRYIQHASPEYGEESQRRLVIDRKDGEGRSIPAEKGRQVTLEDPQATLRIARVFENLQVRARDGKRRIIDAEGEGSNPALKIIVEKPDGSSQSTFLMPEFPSHGQALEGVELRYELPQPEGAVPDDDSPTPAAHVVVRRGDRKKSAWLTPADDAERAVLELSELFPEQASSSQENPPAHGRHDMDSAGKPRLFLLKPRGQVKTYRSEVAILEEGEEVHEAAIEVNAPLHYRGYHLYQHSYRDGRPPASILQVVSDAGLWLVYVGFILLGGGIIGWCWVRPVVRRLKKEP